MLAAAEQPDCCATQVFPQPEPLFQAAVAHSGLLHSTAERDRALNLQLQVLHEQINFALAHLRAQ